MTNGPIVDFLPQRIDILFGLVLGQQLVCGRVKQMIQPQFDVVLYVNPHWSRWSLQLLLIHSLGGMLGVVVDGGSGFACLSSNRIGSVVLSENY